MTTVPDPPTDDPDAERRALLRALETERCRPVPPPGPPPDDTINAQRGAANAARLIEALDHHDRTQT